MSFNSMVLSAALSVCCLALPVGAEEADPGRSPELLELMKERRATLESLAKVMEKQYENGVITYDVVIRARIRVLDADLDLASTIAERIQVHERRVNEFEQLEKIVLTNWQNGLAQVASKFVTSLCLILFIPKAYLGKCL